MRFETRVPAAAIGGRLAHSCRIEGGRVAKGTRVDAALAGRLEEAGLRSVMVAVVEPGDVAEDDAAACLARAFAGEGVRIGRASTGRANLYAEHRGLCLFSRDALIAVNRVDPGITLATVPENLLVPAGRMIATVKIIPFAVPEAALATARDRSMPARIAALRPHTAILIQTTLPHVSERVLDKTRDATRERLTRRDATLVDEIRCDHTVEALVGALERASTTAVEWILVVGASAIADRRDVIPAAIELAGGEVQRFGLPVDPGNLLLVATLAGRAVIGLPGCGRSLRDNGLDRILDRLACGLPLLDEWLDSLAVGGLLQEVATRGAPRRNVKLDPRSLPSSSSTYDAIVLAAGASTRMEGRNKLLASLVDRPDASLVRRVVESVLVDDRVHAPQRVVVVTGSEPAMIEQALDGLAVETVNNPDAASGMASSLVRGLSTVLERASHPPVEAVLVCLGDMPFVQPTTMDALVAARLQHPDRSLFVPTYDGKRGNPVLIGREWFDALLSLHGDAGARSIVRTNPEAVHEVPVPDPGVLFDIDTPRDLRAADVTTTRSRSR